MKVLKLRNYTFLIYALYQYLETTNEQFTTDPRTPSSLWVMSSSSSTSSSADYREKRVPRPARGPERPSFPPQAQ